MMAKACPCGTTVRPENGAAARARVVLGASAVALLAVLLVAATPQGLTAQTRRLTVVQEKAPMFKNKSISSPIIKYLEKGSRLNLLAAEDSFYLVSYGGFEGWVIPYSVQEQSPAPVAETPAAVQETETPGRYLVVRNVFANLREGPGLSYKVIGKAYRGQKVEKFIKRGDWYRVRLPDSKIGFIRGDLLGEPSGTEVDQAALPSRAAEPESRGSVEQRLRQLEQEVAELRSLLLDHVRESRGAAGTAGAGGLNAPAGAAAVSGTRQDGRRIIGNTATKVYHLPQSVFYDKIPEEFRVYFDTEEQARQAGYTRSIK